jgi:EpsI family protein
MSAEFPPDRRPTLSRREVVLGLTMMGAAGLVAARKPNIKLDYLGPHKLDEVLPSRIGRWNFVSSSGLIVPPPDQLALAIYSQLLTRIYYDGKRAIMLLIAYSASQTGFLQVHRPEFCYTAAGFGLSDFRFLNVPLNPSKSIRVNTLTAMRDGGGEKLLYWTRIGNHIPTSWARQRLTVAEDNLQRLIPDAALIRISTPFDNDADSVAAIEEFAREMIAATAPQFRRVLIA